jgi:hypothetical protein
VFTIRMLAKEFWGRTVVTFCSVVESFFLVFSHPALAHDVCGSARRDVTTPHSAPTLFPCLMSM